MPAAGKPVDATIACNGLGAGEATDLVLGIAANEYKAVKVGADQFQFQRVYRPMWALVVGIILIPLLVGILILLFVRANEQWVATIEEDHRQVRVRVHGPVLPMVFVALQQALAAGPGAYVPAPGPGLTADPVGVHPGALGPPITLPTGDAAARPGSGSPVGVPANLPPPTGNPIAPTGTPAGAPPVGAPPGATPAAVPANLPPPTGNPIAPTGTPAGAPPVGAPPGGTPAAVPANLPPPTGNPIAPTGTPAGAPPVGAAPVGAPPAGPVSSFAPPPGSPPSRSEVSGLATATPTETPVGEPDSGGGPTGGVSIAPPPTGSTPGASTNQVGGLDESLERTSLAPRNRAAGLDIAGTGSVTLQFDTGEVVTAEGRLLIGRDPEVAEGEPPARLIPIADTERSVSKTHLVVEIEGTKVTVTDRGSTNGSSVLLPDGTSQDLSADEAVLVPVGSSVTFGQRSFSVDEPDADGTR